MRFLQLVFEDDDPACGLDGGAMVDELPRAGTATLLYLRERLYEAH